MNTEEYHVIVVKRGRDGDTACFLVESKEQQFEITNCHLTVNPIEVGVRINSYFGSYSYGKEDRTYSYCKAFLHLDENEQEGVLILVR